ncbi:MAG TPA: alanine--glyoxylate aminotransferase family protein [Candidatus Binatia bacterium]|jgi:2-aminoethylphosphonate-pyruvate transaminase|nr:alanine--glyoxylate aminotransferase family protein [Candidatus Binatia bacterium]
MILLNPGPVNVSPRVTAALGRGDICHREPECAELLARVRARLLEAFAPRVGFTAVLLTGSGTAAVEAAVTSVCSPGGRLVVVSNGVYGERIACMAEASRVPHTVVASPWTSAPDLDAVEDALRAPDVEAVAVVHHETTTGLINPVAAIAQRARALGKLVLVDAVSSLAGDALDTAACDLVVGTSGKCIQAFPGMAFVLVRDEVMARLATYPRRSIYLSLATYLTKATPFTPAVQVAYALDEALAELLEETVAARIARYASAATFLRVGFTRLGLECVLPSALRSNTITSLRFPPGRTYRDLHDALKMRGFVIYEGQGAFAKEAFRVANMGALARGDFTRFVAALDEVLKRAAS